MIQKVNIQKQVKWHQKTPQNPMMPAWNQVILMTKVVVMTLALQRLVMAFAKKKAKRKMTPPITQTAKAKKMRMPRKRLKTASQALFLLRMK
ncbi:Uncharacterised protein [Salmonella enterica subsp. enterica serovar Typhi]|nr:Uncharacterised protein [Salmonella enterica subsp. enterica serovar Typhi]